MSCCDYLQVVVHQNATFTGQLAERVRYGHFPPWTHLPSSLTLSLLCSIVPSFPSPLSCMLNRFFSLRSVCTGEGWSHCLYMMAE